MPHDVVDQLLVEGELVAGEDGDDVRVWPSQRDIARRFGVAPSLVASFAKQRRCAERKAEFKGVKSIEAVPPLEPVVDDDAPATGSGRKVGRPRKADAPLIPYEELDRLLVFGEVEVLEDGKTTTVYPSYRALAQRYGVAPSVIGLYAKSRNCMKRREQAAERVAVRTEEKLIDLRAGVIAVGEDRLVQMIDNFLLGFEKALEEGRVRSDSPTDVNTLVRLRAFLLGGADSRQEVRAILSLDSLQERYARAMRDQQDVTPAMAGVIEARSESETERAESNSDASVQFEEDRPDISRAVPPRPPTRIARGESDVIRAVLADVRAVSRLACALSDQHASRAFGDGTLEARLLRAAEALEARLTAHVGAEAAATAAEEQGEGS